TTGYAEAKRVFESLAGSIVSWLKLMNIMYGSKKFILGGGPTADDSGQKLLEFIVRLLNDELIGTDITVSITDLDREYGGAIGAALFAMTRARERQKGADITYGPVEISSSFLRVEEFIEKLKQRFGEKYDTAYDYMSLFKERIEYAAGDDWNLIFDYSEIVLDLLERSSKKVANMNHLTNNMLFVLGLNRDKVSYDMKEAFFAEMGKFVGHLEKNLPEGFKFYINKLSEVHIFGDSLYLDMDYLGKIEKGTAEHLLMEYRKLISLETSYGFNLKTKTFDAPHYVISRGIRMVKTPEEVEGLNQIPEANLHRILKFLSPNSYGADGIPRYDLADPLINEEATRIILPRELYGGMYIDYARLLFYNSVETPLGVAYQDAIWLKRKKRDKDGREDQSFRLNMIFQRNLRKVLERGLKEGQITERDAERALVDLGLVTVLYKVKDRVSGVFFKKVFYEPFVNEGDILTRGGEWIFRELERLLYEKHGITVKDFLNPRYFNRAKNKTHSGYFFDAEIVYPRMGARTKEFIRRGYLTEEEFGHLSDTTDRETDDEVGTFLGLDRNIGVRIVKHNVSNETYENVKSDLMRTLTYIVSYYNNLPKGAESQIRFLGTDKAVKGYPSDAVAELSRKHNVKFEFDYEKVYASRSATRVLRTNIVINIMEAELGGRMPSLYDYLDELEFSSKSNADIKWGNFKFMKHEKEPLTQMSFSFGAPWKIRRSEFKAKMFVAVRGSEVEWREIPLNISIEHDRKVGRGTILCLEGALPNNLEGDYFINYTFDDGQMWHWGSGTFDENIGTINPEDYKDKIIRVIEGLILDEQFMGSENFLNKETFVSKIEEILSMGGARKLISLLVKIGILENGREFSTFRSREEIRKLSTEDKKTFLIKLSKYLPEIDTTKLSDLRVAEMCAKIDMILIHIKNISILPKSKNDRVIYHVLDEELIPLAMRDQFKALLRQMYERDFPDLKEKIVLVNKDTLEMEILSLMAKGEVCAAVTREEDLKMIPTGAQALVFQGDTGGYSSFKQIEGIIAALRALKMHNTTALFELYVLLSGRKYDLEITESELAGLLDNPKKLAEKFMIKMELVEVDKIRTFIDMLKDFLYSA
ncbi:MAG: hypothetical protein PHW46_00735, partial [Candidatus Omnitrophica bacterium]|nr:hypothetical protein [Candidatus Omnitrophota bacterium]